MTSRPSAIDPPESHAIEGAASDPTPSAADLSKPGQGPHQDIDPRTGRLRPIPPEEWRARMDDLSRRLAEIDAMDETPDEVYDEVLRTIDEERRRQGRPLAFEGGD